MTLQDYVEDFFDLDITLMSDGELVKARASFDAHDPNLYAADRQIDVVMAVEL